MSRSIDEHAAEAQAEIKQRTEFHNRSMGQKFRHANNELTKEHQLNLADFYSNGSGECSEFL